MIFSYAVNFIRFLLHIVLEPKKIVRVPVSDFSGKLSIFSGETVSSNVRIEDTAMAFSRAHAYGRIWASLGVYIIY